METIINVLLLASVVFSGLIANTDQRHVSEVNENNTNDLSQIKERRDKNKGKKVYTRESDGTDISRLINHYNFYYFEDGGRPYYLADVLDQKSYCDSILEFRVIINDKLSSISKIRGNTEISASIEIIKLDSEGNLSKESSKPSTSQINRILKKTLLATKNDAVFKRLVTSLNEEADFKSSLPQIMPRYYVDCSGSVDNQTALDHYFDTQGFEPDMVNLGYGKTQSSELVKSSDDGITNIISKSVFKTNGVYSKGGYEWGYYANTYTDSGNDKITSLLIYDISTIKSDSINPDTVSITTVLTNNFKYCYDTDVVSIDVPNNYCLGNPKYAAALKYINFAGDGNTEKVKNDDETGYDIKEDNGFCFGSTAIKYVGVNKKYNSGPEDVSKLLVTTASVALGVATSGLSLFSQALIGVGTDIIGNIATEHIANNTRDFYTADGDGKIKRTYTTINGYYNFESLKNDMISQGKRLPKFFETRLQDGSGQFSDSNRGNPLLFKTSSDSINYQLQLYSPSNCTNYAGLISHRFSAEVFNDTTWFLNWEITYLSAFSTNWSYVIGKNIKPSAITVDNGGDDYYLVFGTQQKQTVYFKPKESSYYDIVLHNMPANTTMKVSGVPEGSLTDSSGSLFPTDAWNVGRKMSNRKFLKVWHYFTAGNTYPISIGREENGQLLFGTAKMNIYLSGAIMGSTGSSATALNHSSVTVRNGGFAVNNEFTPAANGQYTFTVDPSSSSSQDTYLRILDSNFNEIIRDDDGWGGSESGAKIRLFQGSQNFVISRFYSKSASGTYDINIYKQTYLPELRGKISANPIWIPNYGTSGICFFSISQSQTRTVKIQACWDGTSSGTAPALIMDIRNSKNVSVAYVANTLSNALAFTFVSNSLYLLKFNASTSGANGLGIYLYVTGA